MLFDVLVCSPCKLSQSFPVDKGLIQHYVSNSDLPLIHQEKLVKSYEDAGSRYTVADKKLSDSLDEFEDLLDKYSVTKTYFLSSNNLQVLLSNGVVVYLTFKEGNVSNVVIVRTLAKVLYGQIAFDGHVTPDYMILICSGKLCLSTNSPDPIQFDKIFTHKIVNLEPEFCYVTHLSVVRDKIMLWTPEGNIAIFSPIGPGVTELCRYCTPFRLCAAQFHPHTSTFVTCQLKPSSQGNVFHALSYTYDLVGKGKKCRILEVIKHRVTHLRADVVCAKYNNASNKLMLGLSTGKVLLHFEQQRRNFSTELATKHSVSSFTWHPSDAICLAVMRNGYIQVYDETLQPIGVSLGGQPDSHILDINRLFNSVRSFSNVQTSEDSICLVMERGPLITMRILLPSSCDPTNTFFSRLLQTYFHRRHFKHVSRLLRNCLSRFREPELLENTRMLITKLCVSRHFNEATFAIGAEVLLALKKEKNISEKGRVTLQKLALKVILKALHSALYREALKLARKLDNDVIITTVDNYVGFCGLPVTCRSPDQLRLSRKSRKPGDEGNEANS